MSKIVLKFNCPDKKGIVHQVTKHLMDLEANILSSQQHLDKDENRFLMRIEFEFDEMKYSIDKIETVRNSLNLFLDTEVKLTFFSKKKRVAVLVSKYDHCLYDLILRKEYGELHCEIPIIVSNHAHCKKVADHFQIPFIHIPVEKNSKEKSEEKMIALLKEYQIDLIVMARYMQILTPHILNEYPMQIINVHHGFLPAFKGAKPYHQAYKKGVKIIGATSHFATEDLDMGPIIDQETLRVDHSHSIADMVSMGRDVEKKVLFRAVQAFVDDRIFLCGQKTVVLDRL